MRGIGRLRMLPHRTRLQHDILPTHSEHHHHHRRRDSRSAFNRCPGSAQAHRDMCERVVPLRRQRGPCIRMLSQRIHVRDSELHALCGHSHRDRAERNARERGWRVERDKGRGVLCSCITGSRMAYSSVGEGKSRFMGYYFGPFLDSRSTI